MIQDHNKHIYRVLSWIFNFNICKLGGHYGGRHLLWQWSRSWQCQVEGAASPASARWYSKHNGCDPLWRSIVAYVQGTTVGKASFPLSLSEETDEQPGALASEGYSPSAFLADVSSHLQCVPRYHQNCSQWPAENSAVVQRIPYEIPSWLSPFHS